MSTCLRCFVAGGTCFVTCRQPWTSVFLSLFGRVFSRSHVMSQTLSVCDFCCARLKVHLDPALPTMCLAEEFERDLSTLRTKYDACHIFQNVSGKFSPPRWIRRGRWRGRLPRPNAQDRTKSVEDFWGKRWEKGTHQYALHPLKSLSTRCDLRCPIPNPMPDGFEIEPQTTQRTQSDKWHRDTPTETD